jgi:hypothetical protein
MRRLIRHQKNSGIHAYILIGKSFDGQKPELPIIGEVARVSLRHAELLIEIL